jgi:hypothetical protein
MRLTTAWPEGNFVIERPKGSSAIRPKMRDSLVYYNEIPSMYVQEEMLAVV